VETSEDDHNSEERQRRKFLNEHSEKNEPKKMNTQNNNNQTTKTSEARKVVRSELERLITQRDELLADMHRIANTHVIEAQRIARAAIAKCEK
jgi:hypothetical protein